MIINEIITKDEMTWYLNKINTLKQYGCEWRTARRICMLLLGPKGFKSCCTFGVLYPVEGNLAIYSQFWVKSPKISALLDCTNSNRYLGEVPIIRREMLYIVHIVREGIGATTGLVKISWFLYCQKYGFFIHLNNVDKTSCYQLYKLRQNNNV